MSYPENSIYFCGVKLPEESANNHFMIVGITGSGKTLIIKMMMKSVLPKIKKVRNQRAIIFDVKQDIVSVLGSIGIPEQGIIILNPFDKRCWEWDIAKDITGPDTSLQVASIIIPEDNGQNRFFTDAARDLLSGVMNVFIEKGNERFKKKNLKPEWTLADVVLTCKNPKRIESVLSCTSEGRDLIETYLKTERESLSILSTLRSRLAPFEVISALWKRARHANGTARRIGLKDFLNTNAVLVLGNNQSAKAPIEAINRILFQRITELMLDKEEDRESRTWFFLDEVRKLGRLPGLDDLMTNGRSKGACVVLGFQDIDGMRSVYGNEIANEITSMPATVGILRVSGVSTPKWASDFFGEYEAKEITYGYSEARGKEFTRTENENESIREKKVFLSSEFRLVKKVDKENGLNGYFASAFESNIPHSFHIDWNIVRERAALDSEDSNIENFIRWDNEDFKRIPDWDDADIERLNIAPNNNSHADGQRGAAPPSTGPRGMGA